jgi:hypothetical protein
MISCLAPVAVPVSSYWCIFFLHKVTRISWNSGLVVVLQIRLFKPTWIIILGKMQTRIQKWAEHFLQSSRRPWGARFVDVGSTPHYD